MSKSVDQLENKCSRCGALTASAPATGDEPVFCSDCKTAVAGAGSNAKQSISLSDESVLTVPCGLCHSQLMVDPELAGTTVECPDCHSPVLVKREDSTRKKRKHWLGRPTKAEPKFDPNAEFSLADPVNRPKVDYNVDPAFGLDDVTEDLLSVPLPAEEIVDAEVADTTPKRSREQPKQPEPRKSRRERYEQLQNRVMSTSRKQRSQQTDEDQTESRQEKRRRARKRGSSRSSKRNSSRNEKRLNPLPDLFRALRRTTVIIVWAVTSFVLGWLHVRGVWPGPLALIEAVKELVASNGTDSDWRLIVQSCLVFLAAALTSYAAGTVFLTTANADPTEKPQDSHWMATFRFGFVMLVTGLPFLYLSILLFPMQLLLIPPLLISAWCNRSWWQVVADDPFNEDSDGPLDWRQLYGTVTMIAVLSCIPTAMLQSGGFLVWPGAFLLVGLTLGVAGICGWHCRQSSHRLETET